ncbi:hypothetical protein EV363DRAFT_1207221 [Boletus edulis]|uniref:Uncharacterized protein n=1 Tax=Boletus edulis BED1 TaxID=1328754 RepID=A0AAD4GHK6_BOLED|nr:hypothetical protein EV363DRAFT_1207221 [Boletus edulis]KAF8445636.1 hypothetical protein L210DRAFT_3757872 [Boletus edulis BED1]
MLQHRATPSSRPWHSIRLAAQRTHRPIDGQFMKTMATTSGNDEIAHGPPSILSRLSDRPRSIIRRGSDTERVDVEATAPRTPRPQATSFISARSAQKRDHAAEKWFTDIRELDVNNVDKPNDPKWPPRKKRMGSDVPKQHEMRPKTDLNALFASSSVRSATSLRLQTKKELGGDYTSYLPDGHADPYRLPIAYARLVLGRNKHIPLSAQTGALNIVEEAIQGKIIRQGK